MNSINKFVSIKLDPRTEEISADFIGKPNLDDVIAMLMSTLNAVVNNTVDSQPKSKRKQIRYEIHDRLNIMFGRMLESLVPSSEIPDLTSEAILEAENSLIKEATERKMRIEDLLEEKREKRLQC